MSYDDVALFFDDPDTVESSCSLNDLYSEVKTSNDYLKQTTMLVYLIVLILVGFAIIKIYYRILSIFL